MALLSLPTAHNKAVGHTTLPTMYGRKQYQNANTRNESPTFLISVLGKSSGTESSISLVPI